MFEHTPDWGWYVALANLTKWFHWPAWAAIFTFIALLNTVRIADRSRREDRRREAVHLMAVKAVLEGFYHPIRDFAERAAQWTSEHEENGVSASVSQKKFIEAAEQLWRNDRVDEQLNEFKINEFPNVSAILMFQAALITRDIIMTDVALYKKGRTDVAERIARTVDELKSTMEWFEKTAEQLDPRMRYEFTGQRVTQSLKSFPAWLRTMWTGLPFPWLRQKASTRERAETVSGVS